MKKILIAIADAGNAHKIAAEAIEDTFNKLFPGEYKIKTIDFLKQADVEPFNTSDTSYALVSKNTFLDNFNITISKILNTSIPYSVFRDYAVDRMQSAFEEIISEYEPDVVICNHPIPAMVLGKIKEEKNNFKYVITMLDLVTFFRSMADNRADLIFAPSREVVSQLINLEVNPEKIIFPVFPLHPKLKEAKNKREIAKELKFDQNRPIVLITGGGLGLKTLREAISKLAEREDLQLIIVTGKLTYFRKELESKYKNNQNVRVFGFVDNMQDFFRSADIVVAKPGATTIMECELFEKKAIFTKRVGHVEIGHDRYISNNPRFRYIGNNWGILEDTVDELIKSEYNEIKNQTKRNYNECEIIVKEIAKLMNIEQLKM